MKKQRTLWEKAAEHCSEFGLPGLDKRHMGKITILTPRRQALKWPLTIGNRSSGLGSSTPGKRRPSRTVNIMRNRTHHPAFIQTQAAPLCRAARSSAPLHLHGHAEELEKGQRRTTGMSKGQEGFQLQSHRALAIEPGRDDCKSRAGTERTLKSTAHLFFQHTN